jgi:hypothetical protein
MSSAATCPAGTTRPSPPRRAPASRLHHRAPLRAPAAPPAPAPAPAAPIPATNEDVLPAVARELFTEVFGLLRRLQPLQSRVPGLDAMDCLLHLMTDQLCP